MTFRGSRHSEPLGEESPITQSTDFVGGIAAVTSFHLASPNSKAERNDNMGRHKNFVKFHKIFIFEDGFVCFSKT